MQLKLSLGLVLGMSLNSIGLAQSDCPEGDYWIGASQDDITGSIVEAGMMGYAEPSQIAEGLHMRLRSRALVIADACRKTTVALVIADLGQVFGGLKTAVIEGLEQELPGVFTHENLLFSATHTHAGAGGFAHHALYNITTLGFNPLNFKLITKGTVSSIVKAYKQQRRGTLSVNQGSLPELQFNRSMEAYLKNPAAERERYSTATDPEMLLLQARDHDGRAIAAFNWFAVHPVSLSMKNKLISGDNKGLAAYLFEQHMGSSYQKNGEFVAGFLQANSGDISPYQVAAPLDPQADDWQMNSDSASAQFKEALRLWQAPATALQGPVAAVHKFTDVAQRQVAAAYTAGAGPQQTCQASLGVSFAAGTENGRPLGIFKEGTIYGKNWLKITLLPEEQLCHQEKVILLPTGLAQPDPWTARVAPFQILRLGQLAIVAAPFEATTMAGRRLKEQLLQSLAPAGIRFVALTTLANDYLHYVTSREEYAAQSYEGGSTLYGPWSLAAYTQIYDELVPPLLAGEKAKNDAEPLDLSQKQVVLQPGVLFDATPRGKVFGDIEEEVAASYQIGASVQAVFWGAHPHNSLGVQESLLQVQRQTSAGWENIRQDWDADTFYRWKRHGLASSKITIEWRTSAAAPGTYRLCHEGRSRSLLGRDTMAYRACSANFELQD